MSSLPTTFNLADRSLRPNRRLAARLLPAAKTTVYECPQSRTCGVTSVVIANVTAAAEEVDLHHVIPTESAGTSNALLYAVSIAANSTVVVELAITLTAGDKLVAQGSTASALCVTVYGSEA